MFRWILRRNWLPISLISSMLLSLCAGFELLRENYSGLLVAVLVGVAAFSSNRFSWIAISLLPIGGYLASVLSVFPVVALGGLSAVVILTAFFASKVQRSLLLVSILITSVIASWYLGYQGTLLESFLGVQVNSELGHSNSFLLIFSIASSSLLVSYFLGRIAFLRLKHIGSPLDIAQNTIRAAKLQLEVSKQNERLEIAKDLSDLLVQRISAVVSVSEGGRFSLVADPSAAQRVLDRTYDAGRAAQAELRRLYDYLNSAIIGDVESFRISDLNELAVAYRELGFNTVISNQGESFALNEGMELCVYKIVFESLSNVRKHAPLGTEIGIDFLWVEDGLQILVKDNGIEVTNRAKRNLGELVEDYSVQDDLDGLIVEFDGATLSALRDRAAIYGGRIEATKVPGVGFTLSAIFPNLKSLAIQEIK